MRFPEHLTRFDEIPADWIPEDLGTASDIRAVITNAIGDIEWRSNGWGRGSGPGFSVEVPLTDDDDELIYCVTLMFRGAGQAPYVAMAIAQTLSARALGSGV